MQGLCKYLEELGIPSPGGKAKWSKTTVAGILQNEKYKGDALIQKQFTVDFLEKQMNPNEGKVKKVLWFKAFWTKKRQPLYQDWRSFMVRWTGLEPVPSRTRPSNVRVCQFRHHRMLLSQR